MTETTVDARQRLTFSTLGPLRVERAGNLVPLGGRQQRAVLAALLVHRSAALSVARIADDIWGERVPAGYIRTIHTYVHHLREALELDRVGGGWKVLTTVNDGYQLVIDEDAIDAVTFERLANSGHVLLRAGDPAAAREEFGRALALWRGDDALADLADFPFVPAYASRLEELRLTAVEGDIDARLALGEHASVIPQLDDLAGRYPLHEKVHAQRMLALYRTGRQAEALAAYRALRQLLDDELGVEPSAPLQQLHQAMLAQDPAIAAPSAAPAVPAEPAQPLPPGTARRWRKRSLAAVAALLLAVGGGIAVYAATHWHTNSLSALPANSVGAIAADGSLHHAVPVGPNPSALAYGAGTLWVVSSTEGRVARIDTGTHRVVQTIPVGRALAAIVVTGDDAWVANAGDGTVSRINATTNTLVDTIPVGALPVAIGAGPSGIWVANSGDNSIQHIDPTTGSAGRHLTVGGRPDGIAVGAHAVWVANSDDRSITEIDPGSGQDRSGPIAIGSGPGTVALTEDAVWVTNTDEQSVERLDPRTRTVVARILVGDGPSSVAIANGRVWVGNAYDGTVTEIEPSTNTVRHRFAIGASPRAMVAVGSSVWIASGAFADTSHVGGTLTVAGPLVPGAAVGIDPASAYVQTTTVRALRLVYDGLVSYHVAGGTAGLTIVPDLATAVPRPSDGGRTYSFTLRRGMRFSDGTPVRASDIKRGVLRSLTVATFGSSASTVGIVGAEHCGQPHTGCDLSRGMIVDDATGSIVFHLNAPDPDFLFKLTYFSQATVPGAPATEAKTPLPGTGPYRISQYRQGEVFELTRNPYFTQWSFAAQQAGYPDTIRWVKTAGRAAAVADVLAGRADLVRLPGGRSDVVSRATTDMVRKQYPGQFHVENPFQLDWIYLNTTVAPFNDIRIRQAINYAVDRRKIVDIYGGATRALPTCQMLPPDFPGYQPYCPYSTGPPDAPYDGANLIKAHTLIAASHTRGMVVTVTGTNDPVSHATNSYLVEVLRSIGYRTHLQELTDDATYHALLNNPKARWQILQATGWLADYPAASDFYLNLFSCRPAALEDGVFAARPCNRALDALAEHAYQAEGTDPGAGRAEWAAIDRKLTDAATVLALDNELEATVVSQRVGNYQSSPELGPLLSQIWVQ